MEVWGIASTHRPDTCVTSLNACGPETAPQVRAECCRMAAWTSSRWTVARSARASSTWRDSPASGASRSLRTVAVDRSASAPLRWSRWRNYWRRGGRRGKPLRGRSGSSWTFREHWHTALPPVPSPTNSAGPAEHFTVSASRSTDTALRRCGASSDSVVRRGYSQAGMPTGDAAAEAGYADQPHLHREVRALAGVPLNQFASGAKRSTVVPSGSSTVA